MQAGIKVESAGSGSYILTFTNTTDGTTYDWNSLPSEVKAATSLKLITESDYKLSKDDVAHIMGAKDDPVYPNRSTVFSQLKSLDMGDANLDNNDDLVFMSCAKGNAGGLTKLTYFIFPKTTTTIPTKMFEENTTIEEVVMLEPDNENDPHLTEIPIDAFKGCTSLVEARIPDGITKIGSGAFQKCAFDNISFPNSLEEIGPNAFESCRNLKSITIPHSVKKIGNSAFQKNTSMTDVYVLGNYVEIEDGAFNQEETYNFKYQQNGDVDFSDWKPTNNNGAGTAQPLILHIPDNDTAYEHYVNPYLRMLNDPDMEELYDQADAAYSNQTVRDKFTALFKKHGIQPPSWGSYDNGMNYNVFKRDNWVTMTDADGKIKKFFKEAGSMFGECPEVDNSVYGGWRNFMLVVGDVEKKTWHDGRLVESRWYSAVFPFDMTYNQLLTAYGVGTDVREFSYVNQHTNDEGQEIRTVTFLKKPELKDKNKDVYVVKGRPYMIHPGVRSVPIEPQRAAAAGAKAPVHRTIAGVDVEAANEEVESGKHLETVTGGLVNGNLRGLQYIQGVSYTFNGTYKDADIPANTFYLGMWPDRPETLGFYVTRVELKGKWTAFTSIVRKTESNSSSYAKNMDLGFTNIIEEDFGITTAVENAIVQKSSNSTAVYNLNGQAVRENSGSIDGLSKGVYVVNGKKIVIR
ncbi:MAG: leucine-rich repeat domain-containing protein [Prevotella sp.]|nr:leucine-rich repeat domain-containing protein [Prevotella sp.]